MIYDEQNSQEQASVFFPIFLQIASKELSDKLTNENIFKVTSSLHNFE